MLLRHLNYVAIVAAAVTVVFFAAAYYIVLACARAQLSASATAAHRPSPRLLAFELLKSVVLASVIAGLVDLIGISHIPAALNIAVALWIAFPVVLLAGSVAHENVPWKLAAIHAGDWLAKLVIITVIVSLALIDKKETVCGQRAGICGSHARCVGVSPRPLAALHSTRQADRERVRRKLQRQVSQ